MWPAPLRFSQIWAFSKNLKITKLNVPPDMNFFSNKGGYWDMRKPRWQNYVIFKQSILRVVDCSTMWNEILSQNKELHICIGWPPPSMIVHSRNEMLEVWYIHGANIHSSEKSLSWQHLQKTQGTSVSSEVPSILSVLYYGKLSQSILKIIRNHII